MENNLTGKYPILAEGENIGELTVSQNGLLTEFEGVCEELDGIIRLSVYGDAEGYLGVMMPERGYLRIKKKLSRAAMSAFPSSITHAGPAGAGGGLSEASESGISVEDDPYESAVVTMSVPESSDEVISEVNDPPRTEANAPAVSSKAPQPKTGGQYDKDTIWIPEPNPWSLFATTEMKAVWSGVKGAITTTEQGRALLAVPAASEEGVPAELSGKECEKRTIEENLYVIFEIKNGKLV